jgi:hypothetical protein
MWGWVEDIGKAVVDTVDTEAEVLGNVATRNY